MDEVAKLCVWLEQNGNTAPWEDVQKRFKAAFPNHDVPGDMDQSRLMGLIISSRGVPQFGKT